jgi:hypothetical protein
MKTWNRFLQAGISLLSLLCIAALCGTSASAQGQYSTLLAKQTFCTNALPANWSGNWGDPDETDWFWPSDGDGDYGVGYGGYNGSAMDDIWDYNYTPLSTPSVDASMFANNTDSVWVDFDFFWEDNEYTYDGEDGELDEINIDANSDILLSGTEATMYTYYNSSDLNFDVAQTSTSYWQHYHVLIPVADRTSNMTISWAFISGQGLSDIAIDNVKIKAYFLPAPELSLNPKTMNFGTATPNTPDTLYATVSSVGVAPLTITSASFATASLAYTILSGPENGTVIPVGDSAQYAIQFLPFSNGVATDSFVVVTNGADSGTQQINMTGIGAVPEVAYSSTSMFRGVDVELTDTSSVQYLYVNAITTPGGGPLTVNSVSFIGLNASDYFITHLPPEGGIPPGGVDSIGVQFVPSLEGLPDAHMVINTNAKNIPSDTVSMDGVGILPHLAIDSAKSWPLPAEVNFDSVQLGSDSTITVQLWNSGSDTLAIEQNYFQSNDPDFTFVPLTGRDTLIPPGGTQNLKVTFTPIQQGTRLATIRIRTNIPNTETTPPQDTSEFIINVIGIGVPTGKLVITGPSTNGNILLDKVVCATDTFWNTGDAPITIDSIAITGPNAADFNATYPALPFTIASNSSLTFSVCAEPSDTGTETAIITAYGSSNESPAIAALPVAVYGQLIADTGIITQAFLSQSCGPDTEIVTVTNTGNIGEAYFASVSGGTNPNDFTVLPPTTSLTESSGGIATFTIVFTPSTTSLETTNLSITGGSVISMTISATGSAAAIAGSGTAPVTMIGAVDTFTATINNTGTCPWTPGAGQIASDPAFTYLSGGTTPIPGGGSALDTFTYIPTEQGTDNATVNFPNQVGTSIPAAFVTLTGASSTAGVAEIEVSDGFSLEQNYPNPFNGTSNIQITLPTGCLLHLAVIDVEGQVVQTVLNQHYDAGSFEITLDAAGLASGTYYYQMTAGDVTLTRQMVVVK